MSPSSPAALLIKDIPHASGVNQGSKQAWTTLCLYYYTEPEAAATNAKAMDLFNLKWPKGTSLEE